MTTRLRNLDSLPELDAQAVIVRVDFNVPMQGNEVTDRTRIVEAIPTLQELSARGARLALVSHRGRPKGERHADLSLAPVAKALADEIDQPVAFAEDCVGETARGMVDGLERGQIGLLENVRFHAGEEANDAAFAVELAKLADIFVGDAFGTAHRAHATTTGLPSRVSHSAAGRLMEREIQVLEGLLHKPERPYAAILGGAKISGKIATLSNLVEIIDVLLVGGGMANTLLAAAGHKMGRSLVEDDKIEVARGVLARCKERGVSVHLPSDVVVTEDLDAQPPDSSVRPVSEIEGSHAAVDIGPDTRSQFGQALELARTVFWNGPMGVFEKPPYDEGSRALAAAVGHASAFSVIGGGETVAAANQAGVLEKLSHVSTGGGASLALLAGKQLPGVRALGEEA